MSDSLMCHCGRPTDLFLCQSCASDLKGIYDDVIHLLVDLEDTKARLTKTSGRGGDKPTKKAAQPLPLDLDAVEVCDEVGNWLATEIRELCEERGIDVPTLRFPGARAAWLAAHVFHPADSIRMLTTAPEFHNRGREHRRKLREAVDNHGTYWAGPCTAKVLVADVIPGETIGVGQPYERECGADLRTRPNARIITCKQCQTEYDPITRMQWVVFESREHMATAEFIADALKDAETPVSARTIKRWNKDGDLIAYAEDELGRDLFMIGDVLDRVNRRRGPYKRNADPKAMGA